ncbi:MAG: Na(+)/H(+) antiporter subunit [Actinomycetota bacterium]
MIDVSIAVAFVLLSLGGSLFMYRLFKGPSVADRVIALDGLLMVVTCGILVETAREDAITSLDTVLVVALVAFVGTGVMARYVERRGG